MSAYVKNIFPPNWKNPKPAALYDLVIIGAGPISCEMAQAFLRLGSEVTLLTRGKALLPKEDPLVSDSPKSPLTTRSWVRM